MILVLFISVLFCPENTLKQGSLLSFLVQHLFKLVNYCAVELAAIYPLLAIYSVSYYGVIYCSLVLQFFENWRNCMLRL